MNFRKTNIAALLAFMATFLAIILLTGCASTFSKTVQVDDETLATNVKLALYSDKKVSAKKIIVATSEGVVHLSGFVKDPEQISAAEEAARKVAGVKEVDNRLEVDVPAEPMPIFKSKSVKAKASKSKATKYKTVKSKAKKAKTAAKSHKKTNKTKGKK